MAEELKGLIEKIQEEGVMAAEKRAKEIELEARRRADEIIKKAQKEAADLLAKAKEEISRTEEGSRASLKQAARDAILTLKKEINATLDRLVASNVREALEPKELVKIISGLIKESVAKGAANIVIALNGKEIEAVEKGLIGELSKEVKKGITLKTSEDVAKGFTISYDAGKSYFDFTDAALAEYIASRLKPKLANLLKES